MNSFLAKLGIATTSAIIITEVVNLDYLWTALITFAVSLITLAGGEFVKYLVALFKKKTKELEENSEENKNE